MNLVFRTITSEVASSPEIRDSALLQQICDAMIAIYPGGTPQRPWAGYLAEEDGVLVGTCGYKSPPMDGAVEIAYFTFPEHEGRGIATHMAEQLVAIAFENGATCVRAQTLPEPNASTRILGRLGFTLIGPVQHPEDGEVWEWRREVVAEPTSVELSH